MDFNFSEIERKWKQKWEEQQLYKVLNDTSKPKYYVLDMFPYPSGAGLHVGHPLGYIASDIYSRYKRMKGFNVLHPMGFDEFGLPTEQYAIETGQHPAKTTQDNIKRYKEQLNNIGFSFDWSREVNTSDPKYYKWTQYLFLQIYNSCFCKADNKAYPIQYLIDQFEKDGNEKTQAFSSNYKEKFTASDWKKFSEKEQSDILMKYRLAYLDYAEVNWCPALGTVLANDEVINGVSERGGHPVEKKKMRQWFLRITAYADRLLDSLPTLDWSKSMKDMQTNWIGRSEGAIIQFRVQSLPDGSQVGSSELSLEIFTTRPDTIFGATFMVMAPEHPMLETIVSATQKEAIDKYIAYVKSKTDVERQQNKQVTGEFTGAYATHPFTNKQIPIYIAEYVLWGYGTGAIMAVPSDDERDRAFAEKFNLPIVEVIDRSMYPNATMEDKVGKLINSDFLNGLEIKEAISKMIQTLVDKQIGERRINYRLRDAGFSRQRYWGEPIPIQYKNEVPVIDNNLPLVLPEVDSFKPSTDGRSPLANAQSWTDAGYETDTMPGYAGSSWYFLRYMDPMNENAFVSKEAEAYWQNVDLYIGGTEHAVGHLLYARLWQNIFFDLGLVSQAEPFKKLVNQGMIQGRSSIVYRVNGSNKFVSKNKKDTFETSEIHCDVNIVDNDILDIEKFKAWREEYANAEFILEDDDTYVCGYEIEKMSKRWYNVVNPDDMVAKYGVD
jgi:leucyl-tRNA synthetase